MGAESLKESVDFSIILPVFNEENCLETLLHRILKVFDAREESYEIICVDDGSSDKTWGIIWQMSQTHKSIKGVKFQRNFGHQIAVYAGIQHSSGQYIAIMDADGQDPPEVLPKFFDECKNGYDVVYAVRKKRKENIFKRLAYKIFYRFYKFIVPFSVPLDSGDFSVFNRGVADFMKTLPEKTPFIRGLRSWYGGKQIGLEYERQARLKGKPKYNLIKLFLLALNASLTFSKMPLRFFAITGFIISITSAIFGIVLIVYRLMGVISLLGWTSTTLLILFFGGLNLIVFGVIGEYIGNIFDEVKNRPRFLVRETIGLVASSQIARK